MSRKNDTSDQRIKVLVADDHELIRYGIISVIHACDDIEVICEASSGMEAIELFKEKRPDVCLLDITMPELNGIETTRSILEIDPEARILILTMHIGEEYLNEVIHAGASGYMLKNSERNELLNGIRAVYKGERAFSSSVSRLMSECYMRNVQTSKEKPESEKVKVTRREREIIQLIAEGHTSSEISEILFISPRTVDTHRTNLMNKLDLKNAAGLVRYALENGLIEASSDSQSRGKKSS